MSVNAMCSDRILQPQNNRILVQ